jgi:hypothetical protein
MWFDVGEQSKIGYGVLRYFVSCVLLQLSMTIWMVIISMNLLFATLVGNVLQCHVY